MQVVLTCFWRCVKTKHIRARLSQVRAKILNMLCFGIAITVLSYFIITIAKVNSTCLIVSSQDCCLWHHTLLCSQMHVGLAYLFKVIHTWKNIEGRSMILFVIYFYVYILKTLTHLCKHRLQKELFKYHTVFKTSIHMGH